MFGFYRRIGRDASPGAGSASWHARVSPGDGGASAGPRIPASGPPTGSGPLPATAQGCGVRRVRESAS